MRYLARDFQPRARDLPAQAQVFLSLLAARHFLLGAKLLPLFSTAIEEDTNVLDTFERQAQILFASVFKLINLCLVGQVNDLADAQRSVFEFVANLHQLGDSDGRPRDNPISPDLPV